jgi:hypothetical protein
MAERRAASIVREFAEHLDGLRKLLVSHKTHMVNGADVKPITGFR